MTAITTKSRQMRLDNCALNTPKRVQIAGNLRENACKDREAATPADAANAGLENNGKIRQIHPNTKLLGKYRFRCSVVQFPCFDDLHILQHCDCRPFLNVRLSDQQRK